MFKPYFEEKIPEADRPHYSSLFSGYPNRILDSQQALYELSQDIRRDPDAASSFLSLNTGEAVLDSLPAWLRERIRAYAAEYGHQLISLDFYFPSMGESYEHTLSALQEFLRYEVRSPEKMREGAERKREQAVPRILEQLEEGSDDHRMMAAMISNYQTNASVREDANFYLQLGWPLMRAAIQELGRRLVAANVLVDPEEIFFVEKEELQGAVAALQRGERPASLHEVTQGRKGTWGHQRQLDAPDLLSDAKEEPPLFQSGYVEDDEGKRFVAQGASPGRHRGRVRIVRSDDDGRSLEKGEVLVTHAASPALTPLMLIAGALVVDVGGGASHSSLVARELGLPAVVSTESATQILRDGVLVEVDGTLGTVKIVKDESLPQEVP